MECFGGSVNRMVCGMGGWIVWGYDWLGLGDVGWVMVLSLGLGLVGLSLVLGDCVWCVLLPKPVAFATSSSKTMPPVSHG